MTKRVTALLLAVLLAALLAACGPQPPVSSQPPQDSSAPAPPPPEPVPPVPLPEPVEADQAYLTGLQKAAGYPEEKRITAVMVNNFAGSRPVSGLSEAEMVVEILVEGGITRFMALFDDYTTLPKVGSVRSARDQFFQLLLPSWGFYIHDGPNEDTHPANIMMAEYDYAEFDLQQASGATFFTDRPGYTQQEHTEYTDAEHVMKAVEDSEANDYRSYGRPILNFGSYKDNPRKPAFGEAEAVGVVHSPNYRTLFEYNGPTRRYKMSLFNELSGEVEPTIDENNNKQLAFNNLLILFAPMELYAESELVKVDYGVGGGGYYFTNGRYEPIVWRKGAPQEALLLYSRGDDGQGDAVEMLVVNPGTTYVAVVDDDQLHDFNTALIEGTAYERVAGGATNPGSQEPVD